MAFLIARLIRAEVARLVTISVHAEMVFFRSNGLAEIIRPGWIIETCFPSQSRDSFSVKVICFKQSSLPLGFLEYLSGCCHINAIQVG